jgi:hypothetical protein
MTTVSHTQLGRRWACKVRELYYAITAVSSGSKSVSLRCCGVNKLRPVRDRQCVTSAGAGLIQAVVGWSFVLLALPWSRIEGSWPQGTDHGFCEVCDGPHSQPEKSGSGKIYVNVNPML